jgi:arylsulfatase A-like enzyme
VPTCIQWHGVLPAGLVVSEPTSTMDLMPTFAALTSGRLPHMLDGKNILYLLAGREKISPHEFMFHYTNYQLSAVRYRHRDCKFAVALRFQFMVTVHVCSWCGL